MSGISDAVGRQEARVSKKGIERPATHYSMLSQINLSMQWWNRNFKILGMRDQILESYEIELTYSF